MLLTSTYNLVTRDIPLCGEEEGAKLVSDMLDSNRNLKGGCFFVKGMN